MSTNYYHIAPPDVCPTCLHNHGAGTTHIGKSSAGWKFHFNGPDGIQTWGQWKIKIKAGGVIIDEYGSTHTLAKLEALVESKRLGDWHSVGGDYGDGYWLDPDGYWFSRHEFS